MTRTLVLVDEVVLLMGASMYFGTGWSTVLFSFPITPHLTVENYYLQFVPQVKAALRVFTALTTIMIATAGIMLVAEWGTGLVWVPILVVTLVVGSAALTVTLILPINRRMAEGITDQAELEEALRRWKSLTSIRVGLWSTEWLAMAIFFAVRARS
jgi:hypothetical protein